jgi:uncharacterized protein (TIGR03067 family)
MRTLLLPALALAASAAFAVAADEKAKDKDKGMGDLPKLQGTWKAMVGPNKDIPLTMVIKDKAVTLSFTTPQGDERSLKGEIKLDESKSPKQWDWVNFQGPDNAQARLNQAIYKIDKDELTICSGGPGKDRPTEFKAGDMGPPNLVIFQRDDKAAPAKPAGDLALMQGRWRAEPGPAGAQAVLLEINGQIVAMSYTPSGGSDTRLQGELTLDQTRSPRQLNLVKFAKSDGKGDYETVRAIYELSGDTLRICSGGPGNKRPTEFKVGAEGGRSLLEYKRVK